ncbi:unnamed protein product [Clonostachys byssicola]|uniref:Uncharacterized protein n=1 Tax=Clonostachys byssicola TaxID=160290 RepID=A0A9N9XUH1_9HYPO|nr:unnamed protein product [Clonostachys byssicola]
MSQAQNGFKSESAKLPQLPKSSGGLFFSSQFCKRSKHLPLGTSLSGQTGIITGASSGIGHACAKMLLDLEISHLIISALTQAEADFTVGILRERHPNAKIDGWVLDLTSYQSIHDFVARCATQLSRIDFAILNAGAAFGYFKRCEKTGHEMVFQVNFLSTMLLSVLLVPVLKSKDPPGRPSRLVIVNSGTAMHAEFPQHKAERILPAFDVEENFDPMGQYANTKFLAHLFVDKLSRFVSPDDVVINLVDPGLTSGTNILEGASMSTQIGFNWLRAIAGRSLEDAASAYIDAIVTRGKDSHGSFIMDWDIYPYGKFYYDPKREEIQEKLWDEMLKEFEFATIQDTVKCMK